VRESKGSLSRQGQRHGVSGVTTNGAFDGNLGFSVSMPWKTLEGKATEAMECLMLLCNTLCTPSLQPRALSKQPWKERSG